MKTLLTYSLLLLIICNGLFAQNLKEIELSEKIGVLNDKAFFNFPQGAIEEARSRSIMAAPENKNEETRIIYDNKKRELYFLRRNFSKLVMILFLKKYQKEKEKF